MKSFPKPSSRPKGGRLDVSREPYSLRAAAGVDLPGMATWELDPATLRLTYLSDGAVAMFGYPVEDWLSDRDFWQQRVHPDDREEAVRFHKQVAATGKEQEIEYRLTCSDGRNVWVRNRANVAAPAEGSRLRGILVDVTASKLAERRLLAQHAVARALAESETVAEAARSILRAGCETLDWQLGALWTVDEGLDLLICEEVFRAGVTGRDFEKLTREIAFPSGTGMPGRVWQSGQAVWVPDVLADDNFPRAPAALKDGLHAAIGFPISIGGRVAGVIEFFANEIREPDHDILSMLESLGNQIGQFIERKRVQEELVRSQHALSDFVENASVGLHWVGPDGTILWANRAELEMLGYEAGEYVGQNIAQFHADQLVIEDILERLKRGERIEEYDARMRAKDGSIRHVRINSSGLWENGVFVHSRCFTRDVTEQKELEEQIKHHAEQSQSIYLISDAVARAFGMEEIYDKAMDAIQLSLKVDRASLLLFDADGVMRFKAWRGLSDGYRSAVEGHSPWTPETADPEPITVTDIETDPAYEELRPVVTGEGIRALAFVPLANQGRLLGKFMLYYDSPHEFTEEEVRLAKTIAGHIAFAIDRVRSEEALRQAEERYRGIFESGVFGAFQTTPDGRFMTANDALARILRYDSANELTASVKGIANQIHVDPNRRAEFGEILQESGSVHNFEAEAYRKDGSTIWISLSARALRGDDGGLLGYEGILEDVTPRKRAEDALTDSELRYRTIFETVGVSVWEEDFSVARRMLSDLREQGVTDLPGYLEQHPEVVQKALDAVRIVDVNDYSLKLFGAKAKEELLGSLEAIFLPETMGAFAQELIALDEGGQFFDSETVVKTIDGRRLDVLFSISFPDKDSSLEHVLVSRTDITERKQVERRQQFLAEASGMLSSTLDYETTLNNVARLVAGRLGDLCSIDLVEDGTVRRVAFAHVDPAKEALLSGMEPTYRPQADRHPVLRVANTGKSQLVNGIDEETLRASARDDRHLKALKALGPLSAMVVPLSVGTRALGAITIVSSQSERRYSELDLALAEELSRRAGMAIENAQLYEAREAARGAAQSAAERTGKLQAVTALLSEAVTPSEVGEVVASAAMAALDARSALIVTLDEKGAFKALAAEGVSSEFREAWGAYAAAPPAPIVEAIRLGQPVFAGSGEELLGRFPGLSSLPIASDRSFACVPLTVEGRAIGSMIVTFNNRRVLETDDRELVLALGRLCAQALERARLYDAAADALRKAENASRRQTFLAEASAILASSLDYETTLGSVAKLCVPDLADWCVIDVQKEDGTFGRVAVVHSDPDRVALADRIQERYPPDYEHGIVSQVIKTGEPLFYAEIPDQVLKDSARDEEHYKSIMELGIKSGLVVPLAARGRTLGLVTLLLAESERRYGEEDLELAQELGRRAGLALDNSRLFREAQVALEVAENSRRRQTFLAEASAILASSLDYETTLEQVAQLAVPELADWAAIDLTEAGGAVNHVAVVHRDPAGTELGRRLRELYPTSYEGGIAKEVFKSGKSFFWPDLSDEFLVKIAQDERHLGMLRELGLKSAVVVPLTARERTFGMLTLVMAESGRRYTEEDLALAQEVARRAAIAIDNSMLYAAEQRSRSEAEAAQKRLWFLAEANAVLSSSLDFEATLGRVAALAVPWLADCCVAHLFPGEGTEARAAASHVDAAKEALMRELHASYSPRPGDPHPVAEMIQSQAPVLVENVENSMLGDIIQDERHREILSELNFKSYMAVPLIARGRLFGALTFAVSDEARRYTQQELSLAEELARRAALALDNARLYEESQRIQDALRVALESKDEFLGVMSHELRTPITAIYGGARVLRSRAERLDEESKNRLMEDIEQESERLFRMVENLLVLSRLELGQEVSTEPVLVQRLVNKLTSAFQQRRPSRPLVVSITNDLEPVAAEPHYLEQILRNLLSNADKYSPSEAPVEIKASARDGVADISVLDRGAGIPPEEIELVFDRFYRSDRTANQAAGIGLGLTVCKRLAEAQAGRIWARPRDGGGLEVGVTLPLCKEA